METGIEFETPMTSFISLVGSVYDTNSTLLMRETTIILNLDQISFIYKTHEDTVIVLTNNKSIRSAVSFDKLESSIMQRCNYVGEIVK